jgi:hypothetical protein
MIFPHTKLKHEKSINLILDVKFLQHKSFNVKTNTVLISDIFAPTTRPVLVVVVLY